MTIDELNGLVGKRVRLWLDKSRTRSIEGIVRGDYAGGWFIKSPDGRGNYVLNPKRDIETLD